MLGLPGRRGQLMQAGRQISRESLAVLQGQVHHRQVYLCHAVMQSDVELATAPARPHGAGAMQPPHGGVLRRITVEQRIEVARRRPLPAHPGKSWPMCRQMSRLRHPMASLSSMLPSAHQGSMRAGPCRIGRRHAAWCRRTPWQHVKCVCVMRVASL
jgi:hypothetical protein